MCLVVRKAETFDRQRNPQNLYGSLKSAESVERRKGGGVEIFGGYITEKDRRIVHINALLK